LTESTEREVEKNKVDQVTTWSRVREGRYLVKAPERQIVELEIETERDITHDLIDVGSSLSIYPQNSQEEVDLIIAQFGWDPKTLIGNKTVKEMLTHDIDIKSEKIKLKKFHSEYDMQFLSEDLKSHPYLTFSDYAMHPGRIKEIPFSIIEDDLPKIRPRYFSIVNDPYHTEDLKKHHEKSRKFKICFTALKYLKEGNVEMQEGFCTSFLRSIVDKNETEKRIKVHFSTVNKVIHF
jgi:sulfite reductase alpha subunit-like flavoprotein